ncbi:MAG: PIG-L family deacetylase [Betaproteobacteria bacterium]
MQKVLRRAAVIACLITALTLVSRAQMRVVPVDDQQGHVALGLVLRHLANAGVLMMATAHPDDENNGLLVRLNRTEGYRTALATATRGNGGQNEIGPEIFEALGVLRTEELAALHRFDGAEQYFTRAVDFGYSFSIDETMEKWGRDEITGDFVRLVRTIRPDVITAMRPDGAGGGQHHQASALLARDAWKLAGDPAKYPDQIREGLHPWQPKKFYYMGPFGFPGEPPLPAGTKLTSIDLSLFDPLLGKTCMEIGTEARSMHKCQGMAQLLALPGPVTTSYQLVESTLPAVPQEKTLFDGIDTTVPGIAKLAGAKPPKRLVEGLGAIAADVQLAQRKFDTVDDQATLAPLLAGLHAVRVLRAELRDMDIDDQARFDIDFRLRQKEREFQQAALVANGITVDVLADDGVVVPGQPVKVSVIAANHGVDIAIKQVSFGGFAGAANCDLRPVQRGSIFSAMAGGGAGRQPAGPVVSTLGKDVVAQCEPTLQVPSDARITEPYWHRAGWAGRYTFDKDAPFGLPFRPTPFYVQITIGFPGGEEVIDGLPVQFRYQGDIFSGEKRSDLLVVPAFSVRISPQVAIVPAGDLQPPPTRTVRTTRTTRGRRSAAAPKPAPPAVEREIRVTVVNDTRGAAESSVALEAPDGWSVSPPTQALKFAREDDSTTVRFAVRPGPAVRPGEYHVRAVVSAGGRTYDRGYQVIEYPHIRRYHIYDPAETRLKVIDVKTAPNLRVGYVMGVGDQVPPAIEQLGASLEMLTPDDLAWGDLSRFDAIVTGVRAYERRADLRASNERLLQYVFNGGTLLVQYNKFEFNQAQYGPYPAKVSSNRVTDESSPVTVLEPDDPLMNFPNRITDATWKDWVQERGLYFLGDKDSRYHDILQLQDPFPYNKGPKLGSLVEAAYGKGHWVYIGLNLWRQLPEGTDGAYQVLANLLSRGKAPAGRR